jgi:hypothetical protein
MAPEDLEQRALRRYERGRLRAAVRSSWFVAPLLALSLAGCGRPGPTLACGLALFLLVTYLGWRGQGYRRAVVPGVLGGTVPLLLPPALALTGHPCLGGACVLAPVACLLGGFSGALVVGFQWSRMRSVGVHFFPLSLVVAGLVGTLGCVLAGVTGVLGMVAGFAAAAIPAYWAATPRQRA